jgi:hypothetical protein
MGRRRVGDGRREAGQGGQWWARRCRLGRDPTWYIICVPSFATGEPPKTGLTGRRLRHSGVSLAVVCDRLCRRLRHSRPSFATGSGVSLAVVCDRRAGVCGRLRGWRLSRACIPRCINRHVFGLPVRSHLKAVNRHSLAMRVLRLRLPWRVSSMKPRADNS